MTPRVLIGLEEKSLSCTWHGYIWCLPNLCNPFSVIMDTILPESTMARNLVFSTGTVIITEGTGFTVRGRTSHLEFPSPLPGHLASPRRWVGLRQS